MFYKHLQLTHISIIKYGNIERVLYIYTCFVNHRLVKSFTNLHNRKIIEYLKWVNLSFMKVQLQDKLLHPSHGDTFLSRLLCIFYYWLITSANRKLTFNYLLPSIIMSNFIVITRLTLYNHSCILFRLQNDNSIYLYDKQQ